MISVENVQQAAKMIKGKVIRTPLVYSPSLSKIFEGEIYLKLENLQTTGSFKIRGVTYTILTHKDEIGHGGVGGGFCRKSCSRGCPGCQAGAYSGNHCHA